MIKTTTALKMQSVDFSSLMIPLGMRNGPCASPDSIPDTDVREDHAVTAIACDVAGS